jgi:phosphonate transport system substrate-binding protein
MDTLTLVALLAPNARPAHRAITACLAQATGLPLLLEEAGSWQTQLAQLEQGEAQGAFICGLPYTLRATQLEAVAAPVHTAHAYAGRAVYWSDLVVQAAGSFRQVGDLRGARWAFNEPGSLSGYLAVLAYLAAQRLPPGFFGAAIASGAHLASIALVLEGEADVAAIDSTVLELALRDDPTLSGRLRSLARIGPNPAPPFVLSRTLAPALRERIVTALCELHTHAEGQAALAQGLIARFVPATDADYDSIRTLARQASGYNPA